MHNLWIFFLKKRAFTYLLMGALTLGGVIALTTIPKESAPEVIIPVGIVTTTLRGASAEDTERLVTDKIEDEILDLDDIDTVTSSSIEGVSIISAQFTASADIDKSITDLKDAIDRAKAELPDEADEPRVTRVNFAEQPVLILSVTADRPQASLADLGDDLVDEIKNVRGVSGVTVSGTRAREVAVVVRRAALERYGLRIDEVLSAIAGANASVPVGSITVADIDYPVNFAGALEDPGEVGTIAIPRRNGAPVFVRDVATVIDGIEAPKTISRASLAGRPANQALTLTVFKKAGGDVTKITQDVRAKLDGLKGGLLADADVVVSFDNGELVERDLRELSQVGLETVLLVLLILFLTIGWRESLVAALSIPLSFVIAFVGLSASGNTINFISLFSLILAIGILVDSGIVVVEAIHTRMKQYGDAEEAAIASIREYAWPLIAGTMTTVAVFVPLFFLSGVVGKFVASIPFTVIFVLLASILVALGMVPLIAIRLTRPHKNRLEDMQDAWAERAREWYKGFLGRILDSRRRQNWFLGLMLAGFVVAIALPAVGLVRVQFFPGDDSDFIYIEVERSEGTPLAVTDRSVREVEEFLYDEPVVASFVTTVGVGSAFNQANQNFGVQPNTKIANITVNLDKERDETSSEVVLRLRKSLAAIASADVRVEEPAGGPPTGAPIVIKFKGDDPEALTRATNDAEKLLASIPGTREVKKSLPEVGMRFTLAIDRAKAAEVGLTAAQIAQTLRAAVAGVTPTTIKTPKKDIDILLKLDLDPDFVNPEDTKKTTVDAIGAIPIATPRGTVLLGSLLKAAPEESRPAINHEDGERMIAVLAELEPNVTALEVTDAFRARMGELDIPDDITIDFGGENEDVERASREMGLALLAGMLLMLGILVLEFNSFRSTLYLLAIIPLSLIGVLAGLMISGQYLSFPSMLGTIALAGVIINHAIILLDSMMHRLRERRPGTLTPPLSLQEGEGESDLRSVILEASAVRLRPIFLTTATTVIGMIPLAGASALWGPLAFAIMFGLLFAICLTLVLIPVLFYRWPGKEFRGLQ